MAKVKFDDLIKEVSAGTQLPKTKVKEVILATFAHAADILAQGNDVHLGNDIGTLKSRVQAAKTAKVVGTDKTVDVPAKTVAKFAQSKVFKTRVNTK